MKTLSVGILQNTIFPYREPFFAGLSSRPNLDVTVLYCDEALDTNCLSFTTEFVAVKNIMGLHLQPALSTAVQKFDVVIIMFNVRYVDMMKLLYNRKLRKNTALILWGHGFGKQHWLNKLRLQMMKRSDGMILYYQEQVQKFVSLGLPRNSLYSVENTIEVANYGLEKGTKRTSFIFVGRLQKRKKVEELLLAFSMIAAKYPGVVIDIVGVGESGDELQEITRELGLSDRVIYYGRVDNEKRLKELFSRAIAYVSPGAIGLGVLHAFAYGCPVITQRENPDHGPEFINLRPGENAILTDSSTESLRDAMEMLVYDDQLAITLQEGAYDFYVSHRTMDNMVENMESSIRDIWCNKNLKN